MEHYDVVVVGGGVMGCSTAYHLAARGRRVLLLEQFAVGHERGSSHGHSRIIRLVYDAPDYVKLAKVAFPLWHAIEEESGAALLRKTGGLDFAAPGTSRFEATCASLDEEGVPFERLDRDRIARRFPQFQLPDDTIGIYQPETGILNAGHAVATLAALARRHGAVLREGEPAQRIAPAGTGVEVVSATTTYTADRLVLTVGAWAEALLRQVGLDVPLEVTKEHVAFFEPLEPALFEPGRFPIFIHHTEGSPAGYGFPIFGLPGVKIGLHHGGPRVEPEDNNYEVDPEQIARIQAYVAQWLPQAAGKIIFTQTCRYTNTLDENFIIDHHPEYPQIAIGSPCSGHGFKFGPVIGRILADLAEHGTTDQPIKRFGVLRFGKREEFEGVAPQK